MKATNKLHEEGVIQILSKSDENNLPYINGVLWHQNLLEAS